MGQEVEKQATERGHIITGKTDDAEDWKNRDMFRKADVVIDFSVPNSAVDNIYRCFDYHIPIVTGTTGWYNRLEEVSQRCYKEEQTLFYAPNFSIGVNLFFAVNEALAALMDEQQEYKPRISEIHHIHKTDAPSGTAKRLAELIAAKITRYDGWSSAQDEAGKIPVEASRQGEVPGTHEITYESAIDKITLRHEAKSRKGFALGAVKAAEWVSDKKGLFTMNDYLRL